MAFNDDLNALEGWVAPLIAKLQPQARRALTRKIALEVRREQRDRIKAQKAPDGTSYAPRAHSRQKQGDIKRRAMFSKIRTAKYMKVATTANSATVEYTGRNARIAAVHQYGKTDYVSKKSPVRIRYKTRPLIGISKNTYRIIEKKILASLNSQ